MKNEQIKELQEALLNHIIMTEFWHDQFRRIETIIPNEIFWSYAKLAKVAYGKSWEEMSFTKMSTEIVKEWLSEQMANIMTIPFCFPNFYDDIKILLQKYIMERPWDEFEKLVNLQEKFWFIEKQRASSQSLKYQAREIYDNVIVDLMQKKERLSKWELLWYSTGFRFLDKITDWLQRWTVTRMVAYANTWKSKFSYHITNQLLEQGANVIYFTLEVNQNTVMYNLMANKYKISLRDVYLMNFEDKDMGEVFWKKLEVVYDKYSLNEIIQYTESRKPDAIIIDFVQNIDAGGWSEYEEMTMVARKLQQLAIKNNIAIFDLSQTSNEWAKSDSDVIHSKGSWALVASADIVMVMKRDTIKEDWIIVKVAKNKFWARKSIDFTIDYEKNLWKEEWETLITKKF
jgi:KaiC/GvpD/RAD55 family RecA-like ATPase